MSSQRAIAPDTAGSEPPVVASNSVLVSLASYHSRRPPIRPTSNPDDEELLDELNPTELRDDGEELELLEGEELLDELSPTELRDDGLLLEELELEDADEADDWLDGDELEDELE